MNQDLAIELVAQRQEQLRDDAARRRLRSKAKRARPFLERARSLANRWRRRNGDTSDGVDGADRRPVSPTERAERVATQGPAAVELELRQLTRSADVQGVPRLLLAVLADPRQPDVARQRAFGRVHVELERLAVKAAHPSVDEDDAA